ncbi:MAG: hypothetical protein QM774_01360 [Gordonia sp. (in: high G+C Gram-positive bacteria)]|uniref:hypothetical protein n=1 Tax=Gordonia sp. (in: high G+C Gram-positive bacteria) TaxID=84139 RepID=UPI0039E6C0E6
MTTAQPFSRRIESRKLYAIAIAVVAVLAMAVTGMPWMNMNGIGFPISWNGLGHTSSVDGLTGGPNPLGWYVIGAGIVALLAAGSLLLERTRPYAQIALSVAAMASLAATAVPVGILIAPTWYHGAMFDRGGVGDLIRDPHFHIARDVLETPVLVVEAILLIVLAVLCAAAAFSLRTTRADD